jgi:MFS family permease
MSSILLPALPTIRESLHTSATGVTWLLTVYFLVGAVATGVVGRFGDMYGKRRTLLVVLAVMAAGTLLGALASSLPAEIAARALQGLGASMFPLGVGIVRDQFPKEKVAGGIGIVTSLLGVGGAFGVTLGGLIAGQFGWHWLFWAPLVPVLVALAGVWAFVPESPVRVPGRVNWLAAVLMTGGIGSILLSVSEANRWGWGTPKMLGLFVFGVAVCGAWIAVEVHSTVPLVDMAMLRIRGIWTTNTASFFIGAGIYAAYGIFALRFTLPTSTGFGFGVSVLVAGLYLLPGAVTTFGTSAFTGATVGRIGSRGALLGGSALAAVAFSTFAIVDTPLGFLITISFLGVGMGLTLPALGNLTVDAVAPDQTGVATGMNTVMRMLGGAVGAQLAATLLDANTHNGTPALSGFNESFLMAGGFLIITVGAALLIPTRRQASAVAKVIPALDQT